MKTYKIEQAEYSIKWHKDREMLEKYKILRVRNDDAYRKASPAKFHAFIYKAGELVACLTRDTYKEVQTAAEQLCSYK